MYLLTSFLLHLSLPFPRNIDIPDRTNAFYIYDIGGKEEEDASDNDKESSSSSNNQPNKKRNEDDGNSFLPSQRTKESLLINHFSQYGDGGKTNNLRYIDKR